MAAKSDVFILSVQQVLFPSIRTAITIPPKTFAELCECAERHDTAHIGVVAIRSTTKGVEDLYSVGTYCRIASHAHSSTKIGAGNEKSVVTLSVEGQCRFRVKGFKQDASFRVATVELLPEQEASDDENRSVEVKALVLALQQVVLDLLQETTAQGGSGGNFLASLFGHNRKVRWPSSPSVLAYMVASGLTQLSVAERQQVLEAASVRQRLAVALDLAKKVLEVHRLSKEIRTKMQKRTEDELRETVLRRQLQDLQRELRRTQRQKAGWGGRDADPDADAEAEAEPDAPGPEEEEEDDATVLREALERAQLSPEAQKVAKRELRRLQNIQPHHPEYSVCRNYLETLASLPWASSSQTELDLVAASEILEQDHYGLEKVKRRILEFLAVQKMRGDMKGPILCLHGPPGVGKTSLGRSIAKALGRKFHRIALGGVRDEAELRGHRRTYIGSMPGNIMQALISLKVNNPVILLDEIDKLTRSRNFNPSGAMLEILDPEQNNSFKDHYINVPFDLSKALFLCTCNELSTIDRPLLDRMEVIDLSGYTVEEKLHIATTHLLPKQRRLHALERAAAAEGQSEDAGAEESAGRSKDAAAGADVPPLPAGPADVEPRLLMTRAAITDVITKWTRESGVRSLDRCLAQICRWAALRLAEPSERAAMATPGDRKAAEEAAEAALADCGSVAEGRISVDSRHLPHILGAELFEANLAERLTVGVAMGLSVSGAGGELLFVEATRTQGSGSLTVTGQLGAVMRESVTTALSLLRSKIYHEIRASRGEPRPVVRLGDLALGSVGGGLLMAEPGSTLPEPPAEPAEPAEPPAAEGEAHFRRVFWDLISGADPAKDPFGGNDIHVHFPAGAIPKDGPSAGIATTLALASLLLQRPVRSDTAVTGEVTLRGHVLPVGGIRDKILAAHRAGLQHVLLPFANLRHVKDELPKSLLSQIQLHYVKHIGEALAWAFQDTSPGAWSQPAVSGSSPSGAPMALAPRARL